MNADAMGDEVTTSERFVSRGHSSKTRNVPEHINHRGRRLRVAGEEAGCGLSYDPRITSHFDGDRAR